MNMLGLLLKKSRIYSWKSIGTDLRTLVKLGKGIETIVEGMIECHYKRE